MTLQDFLTADRPWLIAHTIIAVVVVLVGFFSARARKRRIYRERMMRLTRRRRV